MRIRSTISAIVLGIALLLGSCVKSSELPDLELSVDEVIANQDGNGVDGKQLRVIVTTNGIWKSESKESWIKPIITQGMSRTLLYINLDPNFTETERTGTLRLYTDTAERELRIIQKGGKVDIEEITYEIPVIFHILYNKEDQEKHRNDSLTGKYVVNSSDLERVIEYVNRRYGERREGELEDEWKLPRKYSTTAAYFTPRQTKIKFVLADTDPNGKEVSPLGVRAVEMSEHFLDPNSVLNDQEGGRFREMSWPISSYVNVFIFPFVRNDETPDQVTLGIAHLPNAIPSQPIEGLNMISQEAEDRIKNSGVFDGLSNYNHCIVINADAFEHRTYKYTYLNRDLGANTIAHELGHYLGLFHTFSEETGKEGDNTIVLDSCQDTDYCADTPSYNRAKYLIGRQDILAGNLATAAQMAGLLGRTDCSGARFDSTNIMDYAESYSDEFTLDQISRMRQVLYYSYFVPGVKVGNAALRAASMRSDEVVRVYGEPRAIQCQAYLIGK